MLRKFQTTIFIPGTLTADKTIYWTVPSDCTLVHVSINANTQDGTLILYDDGTAITDTLTATAGTTPVEADRDDMVGDQYPHIADGSIMKAVVGHGSECVDFFAVLTFVEG